MIANHAQILTAYKDACKVYLEDEFFKSGMDTGKIVVYATGPVVPVANLGMPV